MFFGDRPKRLHSLSSLVETRSDALEEAKYLNYFDNTEKEVFRILRILARDIDSQAGDLYIE